MVNSALNKHGKTQAAWLLRAVTCVDLTTLSGDDTAANVHRLCLKAARPVREDILTAMDMQDKGIAVGAVCVYPERCKNNFSPKDKKEKNLFYAGLLRRWRLSRASTPLTSPWPPSPPGFPRDR